MNCLRLLYFIFQGQGVAQYLQFSACESVDQALKTAKVALLCGIIQTHKHCFPFLGHGNAK